MDRYTAEALPAETAAAPGPGGAAQKFLTEHEVPRNWWTLFGSAELDALVSEALRANPDVLSAQAALRQALENTAAQRGSFLSQVQGSFDASRNRDATGVLAPNLTSGTALYNLFTPQVTVSYVPDVFGANRRRWNRWRRKPRPPLPTRRHLSHAHRECGDRGDSGRGISRADRRH